MVHVRNLVANLLQMRNGVTKNGRSGIEYLWNEFYDAYNTGIFNKFSDIKKKMNLKNQVAVDYGIILKYEKYEFRRDLVRLLFKLSAIGDGIKNNEWNYILQAMGYLKMSKRDYDNFRKYYSPLRTETDDYSQYYTNEEKQAYATASSALQPYYGILGVKEGVSKQELQEQYHLLALKNHPDRPDNAKRREECEKQMALINDAYARIMASF